MTSTAANILEIEYSELAELPSVAQRLMEAAGGHKFLIFDGEMGAGKTTLIKAICAYMGVEENVTSPTFSIVNEYQSAAGEIFYHFDFYRIKEEIEALDIGAEEYFYSGNYCFIEWPSKIPNLLPDKYLIVTITPQDKQTRIIQLSSNEN